MSGSERRAGMAGKRKRGEGEPERKRMGRVELRYSAEGGWWGAEEVG